MWAARRDRILTPPAAAWAGRLGLRPQPVFTAQVLQFEDQLAAGALDPDHPLTARFRELPPAGYLPMPAVRNEESLEIWLEAVFDDTVQLRLIACSADVAVSAVNLAQHLDRIPLIASAELPAGVTILCRTSRPTSRPSPRPTTAGWRSCGSRGSAGSAARGRGKRRSGPRRRTGRRLRRRTFGRLSRQTCTTLSRQTCRRLRT